MKKKEDSIAGKVRAYLENHPSMKDAVVMDVANYSALARNIKDETGINKRSAIGMALRRYREEIGYSEANEKKIVAVLKGSSIEVKTKMVSVTLMRYEGVRTSLFEIAKDAGKGSSVFFMIEGSEAFTVITNENHLEKIQKALEKKIIRIEKRLSMLLIRSPPQIEDVPGVAAFLTGTLAHNNINIAEMMSCWKDTIFMIKEEDTGRAIDVLKAWL